MRHKTERHYAATVIFVQSAMSAVGQHLLKHCQAFSLIATSTECQLLCLRLVTLFGLPRSGMGRLRQLPPVPGQVICRCGERQLRALLRHPDYVAT